MRSRKAELSEFVRWLWGVHDARPPARLISLYQRAVICQAFPAYRLDELRDTSVVEISQALELLATARKALSRE